MSKDKFPFVVYWYNYDRTTATWKPLYKWQRCSTIEKANRLKTLLENQAGFRTVFVAQNI